MDTNENNLCKTEGYALMAAAFEVYHELGAGFFEEVYQESMEIELGSRAIPFSSKPRHPIWYKNHLLKKYYDSDLLVNAGIVVELKAVKALTPEHDAQMLNELRAARLRVGYLINFG